MRTTGRSSSSNRIRLLVGTCLAAAVCGCGGSSDSSSPSTATTSQTTTKAPPPAAAIENPAVRRMGADAVGADAATLPQHVQPTDPAFLRAAFDSAQEMWRRKFASAGMTYEPAHLILFHTQVHTPCGVESAETGPFYCPAAKSVYLNTDFFDALARAYGLNSPFAAGYITAHEVAHHVQLLLGVHTRVAQANAADPEGSNRRSIAVELQADCYAGIWLHNVAAAGQLTDTDVEAILRAAAVVGDDFQRNKAGAELAPETWTHGSSEQRVHWVTVGKQSGAPADCDTFG
jgi:predicted metalloprotease